MIKHDPKNYLKLSEPHPNSDAVHEALKAFYEKVEQARNEFNIADVLIVIKDSVVYKDNEVGAFFQHSQFGNSLNGVSMAAYAYGKLQEEQRQIINSLMAGKND